MSNSEIRTLQFQQGVSIAIPPNSADSSNKVTLANNALTSTGIGYYLDDVACTIIDYFIYRRTDSGFKYSSGRVVMNGVPDAVANVDKWTMSESGRVDEVSDRGIVFSLVETDTKRNVLYATLDNMAGANHSCIFYYKLTNLLP